MQAVSRKKPTPQKLYLLVTLGFILGISLLRGFLLPETDVLWNIRAGQDTLAHGIPTHDSWNWLLGGKEWLTNSWLWNVLLAVIYTSFGIVGVALFTAIMTAATLTIIKLIIRQISHLTHVGNFFILVTVTVTLLPWLNGRAQHADYLLVALFILLLTFLMKYHRIWLVALAFVLTMIWMNMHLTAPLALAIFPASYWFITQDDIKKRTVTVVTMALAVTLGLLCTPFGVDGVTKTLLVVNESRNVMVEWMPVPYAEGLLPVIILSLLIFGVGILFLAVKEKQWLFSVAILCLALLSYNAIRFTPFLIIFSLIGASFIPQIHLASKKLITVFIYIVSASTLLMGIVFATYQLNHVSNITLLDPSSFDDVPQNSRMLTLQNGGGTVLLFRQDVSPSLDGRNDIIGEARIKLIYSLFYTKDAAFVDRWLEANKVDSVFIQSDDSYKLTEVLEELGWQKHAVPDGSIYTQP